LLWFFFPPQDKSSCTEGDDRRAHGDIPLLQWLMARLAEYYTKTGLLLVTHFDIHAFVDLSCCPSSHASYDQLFHPLTSSPLLCSSSQIPAGMQRWGKCMDECPYETFFICVVLMT
jgi:hypothetical protein